MKYFLKTFLLMSCVINAQDYKKDITNAVRNMVSFENYSMKVHYNLYLDNKLEKPFQETSVEIKRKQDCLFYKNEGEEFMENAQYEISVNENSKKITARKKETGESQTDEATSFMKLDIGEALNNSLSFYTKVKIVQNSDEKLTYELFFSPNEKIKGMTVTINKKKNVIERIRYEYLEPQEIVELGKTKHNVMFEITYENVLINSIADNKYFNERKYVSINKGSFKPTEKYSGYKLEILN
jgi:hypothetical protein